jgi:twitching motility protein PilT
MISPLVTELLRVAVESDASDLILHSGKPAFVRVAGQLLPLESGPIADADFDSLWDECGAARNATDFDAALTGANGARFRVNLLRNLGTRAAVLRRIRSDVPPMESLGLPVELLQDWTARKSGIILVCGPTGSGKSTTVASALEWINQTSARHIVTIEDPVEFVFAPRLAIFTQREVGIDTPTFAEGLRRSLRQNPDVIFLGEIRDAESARTAIQAAETGHLVLATLHASTSADVVARIELLFPVDDRESVRKTLAAQLHGILCQRLIPTTEGSRALLCEFFSNVGSSRRMIAEGRIDDLQDFVARGDSRTTKSLATSMIDLIRAGRIDESTALENSDRPQELLRILRGVHSSSEQVRR